MHRTSGRAVRVSRRSPSLFEPLETRRLLCLQHIQHTPVIEERPDLVGAPGPEVLDPADIVWTNRGQASDGFAARFGTSANLMRGVVDAVIVAYEKMIGSFDYPVAAQTYNLSLSMSGNGSGFGAGASLATSLGGKPKSGSISMGAGNGSADPNDTNGWFGDPTPFEHSEFAGNIVNAFCGDAQAGSPAAGIGDFYTVVAAEMTHCMGLFGNALPGWQARTTNTGIPDNASPPGFFWVFQGPSIKHLLTSDNGGFQDWGSAVHSAEGPGANINFGGDNYVGAHDQGNPFYEFGRRYMINETFSLMFKDAYNYAVNPAARQGTTYSIYNETTDVVSVRGGTGVNNDTISITRVGNIVSVSVDPTVDVPGTGNLPGAGNLAAWVTEYDLATQPISSITINAGDGTDTISVGSNVNLPITVNVNTDASGSETVNFTSSVQLAALNIGQGGNVNMPANGNRVLSTKTLSIHASSKLDLFNNDLILDYTGASQLAAIQALINSARSGGTWLGNGITSTTARTNPQVNTTLGAIEASSWDALYGAATPFTDGVDPDSTAVLVKYTYYGDTDFNGQIDGDDYVRIDTGFNSGFSGWLNGDSNGDGVVDGDDYTLIDNAFGTQSAVL
jgi:hypothetical protein